MPGKIGFGKVLAVVALFLISIGVVIGGIIVESQQQFIATVVEKENVNGVNWIVIQGGEILITSDDIYSIISPGQTYLFVAVGVSYEPMTFYRTILTAKNMPYCDPSNPGAIMCGIPVAAMVDDNGTEGNP